MLITNFAAGELAESLFGRIDIPQYFSGASKLENFDVIPTGGIIRRSGMERITQLDNDGRLIPFVVNRDFSFILYLTPGRISVFKLENGRVSGEPAVFDNAAGARLFDNLNEINEVQFAQNFDTMILVHENYHPLEIKLENNNLNLRAFYIDYKVTIVADEELSDSLIEFDNFYFENNILKSENNYPVSVSFFNGRLVFAGTKNNPQRVFISSSGDIHNFSTYKKFLFEEKEYLSIFGSIEKDGSIEVTPTDIPIKFVKPINEYFVDSIYFPKGARISALIGNRMEIEPGTMHYLFDEARIENELNLNLNIYNTAETKDGRGWYNNSTRISVIHYRYVRDATEFSGSVNRDSETEEYICHGVNNIQITSRSRNRTIGINNNEWTSWENRIIRAVKIGGNEKVAALDDDTLKHLLQETLIDIESDLRKRFNEGVNSAYNTTMDRLYITSQSYSFTQAIQNTIENFMFTRISGTMKYYLKSECGLFEKIYIDLPANYRISILPFLRAVQNIYINFYSKNPRSDSHPAPDNGFTFEIASDMNDAIRWLAVNKGLIIGTESAEWIIPPGVHATNVQAVLNSRFGSDKMQGTAIGDATCFFQAGKKALIEYYIPQQDNHFRANNMAMLSENMLRESPAKEFDFLTSPYTKLFITREDGTAATLLYERSSGTFAWGRITTAGKIKSSAVIPGTDGYDELYLLVDRSGDYFLEVLHEDSGVYLDSYRQWDRDSSDYSGDFTTGDGWIGYPYTSRVQSMPVLANAKMKPNNIKNLLIRFMDSFMPKVKSLPNESTDIIPCTEPYTGIWKKNFPGVWERDVMFEFIHDKPTRCKILSIYAEVN